MGVRFKPSCNPVGCHLWPNSGIGSSWRMNSSTSMRRYSAGQASCRIFTIGHGGRSVDELVEQLRTNGVDLLIDVRSVPYSRYQPAFSREALASRVREGGLEYGFMGKELGGRPQDPACYDKKRRLIYEKVRGMPYFQEGIARLQDACARGFTICLLCAEANPVNCHRSSMVGVALAMAGVEVEHLLKDGSSKSQNAVVLERAGGQYSLFAEHGGGRAGDST